MRRYICESCRVKWFLPVRSVQSIPEVCPACQGALIILDDEPDPADRSFGRR